jgi:hypothetical protein
MADSVGSKSGNGSWNGMMVQVISGIAELAVSPITVTKTKSEVVAYTDTVEFIR